MRFVLLAYTIDTEAGYRGYVPLSLASIGTYFELRGISVEYYDARIHSFNRFFKLLKRRPIFVGFSVMGAYQITTALKASKYVKKRFPDIPVVWGGYFPTMLPEEVLNTGYIDFVITREGEETACELSEALVRGQDNFSRIFGLAWSDKGQIIINKERGFTNINKLPFAYQGKAIDLLGLYRQHKIIREKLGYEMSKGCSHACTFCYNNFYTKHKVRIKTKEKIKDELKRIKKLGVDHIEIYDDTLLGGSRKRIYEILPVLKSLHIRWEAYFRFDLLSEDLVKKMKESGCRWLFLGIESINDKILKKINKGETIKQIESGIRLLARYKINAVYSFIAGLPFRGEEKKIPDLLRFISKVHAVHPDAEIQLQSFFALPRTPIHKEAVKIGIKSPRNLREWSCDQLNIKTPLFKDKNLTNKLYISSFFAYRYRRHFSTLKLSFFYFLLHKISLWRIEHNYFKFYFEKVLYRGAVLIIKGKNSIVFFVSSFRNVF